MTGTALAGAGCTILNPAGKGPPVVITRPLAQATALAERVARLGRQAVVWPLLEILPLPDTQALRDALADLSRFAMVAFVSPNAIDACMAHLPDALAATAWPRQVSIAVIGEGSRAALARHGITDAVAPIISPFDAGRTDSSTLLASLDLASLQGREVLIIRGESGRELLYDALHGAGVRAHQVAAYRRQAPQFDAVRQAQLKTLLASEAQWIVTSSEALRNLFGWIRQMPDKMSVARMQRQHVIVPHARIAETAQLLGFSRVTLTGSGDEAVLAALQSNL